MMTAVAQQAAAGAPLAEIIEFVHAELDLLDRRQFEDWADLFTEDGRYWSPIDPDQPDPLNHVSLFFDDKPGMKMRIYRLRHPMIHMQTPPSRYLHMVTNFRGLATSAGETTFKCNFLMFEYRRTRSQSIVGGTYDYRLVRDADQKLRIKEKKATLVNSEDSFPSLAVWF
jgi:3-phenylpropionate/cinnamic acid dioxygenase small subunit